VIIKHPYLGIVQSRGGSLIVMTDAGAPLTHFMQSPHFRQRWARFRCLQRAFFAGVGLSTLNLVDKLDCCHNDIHPPNIALRGESFCLLSFEFACSNVTSIKDSAFGPWLPSNLEDVNDLTVSPALVSMMCFSVLFSGSNRTDSPEMRERVQDARKEQAPPGQCTRFCDLMLHATCFYLEGVGYKEHAHASTQQKGARGNEPDAARVHL
jgi:hypothetical protein